MLPTSLDTPLRFEPFFRPMPWGGRDLHARLAKDLPTSDPYGESWEISDHPQHRSVTAEGTRKGQSIRALMEECPRELLGNAAGKHQTFPWLFKFLDACDWLSVQVHPDEGTVASLWPGEGPKSEAWFILDARPGSRVYAGLRPGIGPEEFRAALLSGTATQCLHDLQPRPGDCLYLPAGTVHAIGGGVLFAEIQQTSDATFRLFDWNRRASLGKPRQLHIDKGMAAIHWDQGQKTPVHVEGFSLTNGGGGPATTSRELVRSPYFHLDFLQASEPFPVGGKGRLQAIMVFSGRAVLDSGEQLAAGQVWLFPAAMRERQCRPLMALAGMLCTLP
ncbi:MAG: class I mannose-6-phosphate isomerase [Planctomycetes bacterium]|nr:class I mannose-6-phosphate isomerase [Planctomycetota bacterium]